MIRSRRRKFALIALLLAGLALLFATGSHSHTRWSKIQSENFDYFYLEDQGIDTQKAACALERLEWFWELVAPVWDFPGDKRIAYYKHASREDLKEATGRDTNALAFLNRYTVHTINYADAHEVSHLLTTQFLFCRYRSCHLSLFWLEGLAMYYTWPLIYFCEGENILHQSLLGTWQGRTVHCHARDLLAEGNLLEVGPCIYEDSYFKSLDIQASYPAAGSFITYLLGPAHVDPEAFENFKIFLAGTNQARSEEEVREIFAEVFGAPLEEVEASWHQFLRDWCGEGHSAYCKCNSLPT